MSHAIVMGGSIAGLCAAAALASNFDHVTVLERDPEPGPRAGARRGVPQGSHAHMLLRRGQIILNELFPGAFDALAQAGALRKDLGTSFRWFQHGQWKVRSKMGVDAWYQSRPLLEHHLRQSLKHNPKVELRFEAAIEQPLHTHGKVHAVRMRDGSVLDADLVVDATGRGSRSTTWLREWGYAAVPEQRVRIGVGYVSGLFKPDYGHGELEAIGVYQHAPVCKRFGLSVPLEGDHVMVTLGGYHGDHAPTDVNGFRNWARTLLRPDISDALAGMHLVSELRKMTFPEQVRRCYARMLRLPDRYLVIGDAMCSFDPTFGQGMLVSAIQASLMATDAHPGKSTRRLQRRLSRATLLPFTIASSEAHRWRETQGWSPAFGETQRAYMSKIFDAASHDRTVYHCLTTVMHFLAAPTALFDPRLMWRVLRPKPSALEQAPAPALFAELSSSSLQRSGY